MIFSPAIVSSGNVEIEMTKGVTTKHTLQKKDNYGEVELQEMCFYLENKFQVLMMIRIILVPIMLMLMMTMLLMIIVMAMDLPEF